MFSDQKSRSTETGFSLLELMVAFAVAALLLGVATPMGMRVYDSSQYHSTVRQLQQALQTARHLAITRGAPIDAKFWPDEKRYQVAERKPKSFSDKVVLSAEAAVEVGSSDALAVVRFYPDGSSSGGLLKLSRTNGEGVTIAVDWLFGKIVQIPLEPY